MQFDTSVERRSAPRSRVLLSGAITGDPVGVVVDCRVLNLSDHGALLVVGDAVMPAKFKMTLRDKTFHAEARWRDGPKIGVRLAVEAGEELAADQLARELHDAKVENKWLKARHAVLLKRLAEVGYVEADEF